MDESIGWFERVAKQYGNVELPGVDALKEYADMQVFRLKHLEVGRVAQDIQGEDLDGMPMKLSEYRGKIVVLDFWVDWCPHCRNMYPKERELVERFKDQPFAIVGVNCEANNRAEKLSEARMVTWRNWKDGQSGPIAEEWQVNSYPSVYILDAQGVIRYKGALGAAEVEAAVVELLEEQTGKKLTKKNDSWMNRMFGGEKSESKSSETVPREKKKGEPGSVTNPLPARPFKG
ncbi:MAG: TlpA disulfide reductase family protein [Pirellulales bacterium]